MQITLCSIDMRRIVKGLYLVGKKSFFDLRKKWFAKGLYIKRFLLVNAKAVRENDCTARVQTINAK